MTERTTLARVSISADEVVVTLDDATGSTFACGPSPEASAWRAPTGCPSTSMIFLR
jgi:hypothetical protein